jgi:TRAP-type C4-dicarboxylate transport system substrate-binding protein
MPPPFFISDKFMSKLSAEEKAAVYASAQVANKAARKQVAEQEASIITKLKKDHGVKFTSPDTKPFIAAAAKVHAAFAKKRGGNHTKLIEAINAAAK